MNPVLDEIIRTGSTVSESGAKLAVHSHIPVEEGLFLQRLVAQIKPQISVEVGLAYGVSSLFICEILATQPAARHIVIDPHQYLANEVHSDHKTFEGSGLHSLKRAGYSHLIDFRDASSELALPQLVAEGLRADFAFIDGWHTFDSTLVDFFYVDRLLKPGGVVVLDDTDFPSVWKFCRYLVTNRDYTVIATLPIPEKRRRNLIKLYGLHYSRVARRALWRLTHHDGLVPFSRAIAFRKNSNDSRSWDFHRPF